MEQRREAQRWYDTGEQPRFDPATMCRWKKTAQL
jgi:hypothetical protein